MIEEQDKILKLFNLDAKVERTQEDSQNNEAPTPDKEEVLPVHSTKESQQREVTMPKEDKNQNGKMNYEMKPTEKKAKKLS